MKLKNVFALVIFIFSSGIYAGHPDVDVVLPPQVPVTIPLQGGSWSVAADALYFRPASGDFHYAYLASSSTLLQETKDHFIIRTRDREYDWGGKLDVSYLFPGKGADINVTWTHYHHDDPSFRREDAFLFSMSGDILEPSFINGNNNFPGGWDTARPKSANQYDSVDLVWGQKMTFGQKVMLRAFGGLRYADISTTDTVKFSATAGDNDQFFAVGTFRLKSEVKAFGPRAGMDAQVRLGCHTSIRSRVAGALLAGNFDQKRYTSSAYFDQVLQTSDAEVIRYGLNDSTNVIPEMDARIGFHYSHPLSPSAAVGFEVGYEATHYWGAKNNSIVSYTDSVSHYNDFALHGPYLRVQLDVA